MVKVITTGNDYSRMYKGIREISKFKRNMYYTREERKIMNYIDAINDLCNKVNNSRNYHESYKFRETPIDKQAMMERFERELKDAEKSEDSSIRVVNRFTKELKDRQNDLQEIIDKSKQRENSRHFVMDTNDKQNHMINEWVRVGKIKQSIATFDNSFEGERKIIFRKFHDLKMVIDNGKRNVYMTARPEKIIFMMPEEQLKRRKKLNNIRAKRSINTMVKSLDRGIKMIIGKRNFGV